MIKQAKEHDFLAIEKKGINSLRLDCNLQRNKLRMLYENEGFIYAGKKESKNNYDMALYVWHI